MIHALSDEHADCINWRNWARDSDPKIGYPRRWPLPDGERQETTEDAERPTYDVQRALATDSIFTGWIRAQITRHFFTLHDAYYAGRKRAELDVLEALRALSDAKADMREARAA